MALGLPLAVAAPWLAAQEAAPAATAANAVTAAAAAPASALPAPVDDPGATSPFDDVRLSYDIQPDNSAARKLLESGLDVLRVKALSDGAPLSPDEWQRLISEVPQQSEALLQTLGYFNADVRLDLQPLDGRIQPMTLVVQLGPQARVGKVKLILQGDLQDRADAGDAAAQALAQDLPKDWPLPSGTPFTNDAWSSAKSAVLTRLRAQGYAGASWLGTSATVQASKDTADLYLVADSGPLYRLGDLQVSGIQRQDEDLVTRLSGLKPGDALTEDRMLSYQERLQRTGVFESSLVTFDPSLGEVADPSRVPLQVRVKENDINQITVSAGVATETGPRLQIEQTSRRLFGRALTGSYNLVLSRPQLLLQADVSTLPGSTYWRNVFGGSLERLDSNGVITLNQGLQLSRRLETRDHDRSYFLAFDRTSLRDSGLPSVGTRAVTVNATGVWRRLDNIALPTQGYAVSAAVAGGWAQTDAGERSGLVRLLGRYTWFRPLPAQVLLTARAELGTIWAKPILLPDSIAFHAGGDNSVRGYGYRGLTPVGGGSHLFTSSVELSRPILESLPILLGAVFVDAGRAANSWGELRPALGYGVGVRVRSPIGALSIDVAKGNESAKPRLHLNVGMTF
ncbi:BamA/TamA family outer membrane protein [Comamonadaceae bacterium SL12-8]|uniref:BamA/TamA family outer membrane protein n=2 Tax=Amphibiibacter pelophylacis TaxID=1799477 RepID=A0ACC6P3B8_9BURK